MLDETHLPDQPFRSRDLVANGVTRRALDTAVRDGVVRRVFRGVYVPADLPDTVQVRARAASLVLKPHVVAVDRTAAWIHGVDVMAWHETEILPPVEAFALRTHTRPRRSGVHGGTRDLWPADLVEIEGVRLTTPVRTAVDLACRLAPADALAALDSFAHRRLVDVDEMRRLLPRYFRRRGVVQARWLCAIADGRAESPGESWVRLALLRRGLPTPTLQHWVSIDGVPTYRLDLSYPRHRVAIEYDGEEHHATALDKARDRKRRARLRELGWTVIVVDRHGMTDDQVDVWTGQVRAALTARRSRTAPSRASK